MEALAAAPLGFSDRQLEMIFEVAADLPVEHRDGLLRRIAAELRTWPPTDAEQRCAITAALGSAASPMGVAPTAARVIPGRARAHPRAGRVSP